MLARLYIVGVRYLTRIDSVPQLYWRFYFLRSSSRKIRQMIGFDSIGIDKLSASALTVDNIISEASANIEYPNLKDLPVKDKKGGSAIERRMYKLHSKANLTVANEIELVSIYRELKQYDLALGHGVSLIKRNQADLFLLGELCHCALAAQNNQFIEYVIYPYLKHIFAQDACKDDLQNDESTKVLGRRIHFIDEIVFNLLEYSQTSLALSFLRMGSSMQSRPEFDIMIDLVKHLEAMPQEVESRVKLLKALVDSANGEINQVGSIVWGKDYIDAFMQYNLRSMLASGNMPALKERGLVVHTIVTTESGKKQMQASPVFNILQDVAHVEFFTFPEHLLGLSRGGEDPDKMTYILYGMLDHINVAFAKAIKSNLFLIPVDSLVSKNSFKNMRRYLDEGYDCCGAGNLVASREHYLPALDEMFPVDSCGVIEASTEVLATLALKHPHHYITSQLIHDGNEDFGRHPRELFWPTEGGIYVHSIYTHPLIISSRRLQKDFVVPMTWADFLLPPRMFPDPEEFDKYKIIENAEEAYINNFAPQKRRYETTGRKYRVQAFINAHTYSFPLHRHMLNTRQFIPCDHDGLLSSRDVDLDIDEIKKKMAQVGWFRS